MKVRVKKVGKVEAHRFVSWVYNPHKGRYLVVVDLEKELPYEFDYVRIDCWKKCEIAGTFESGKSYVELIEPETLYILRDEKENLWLVNESVIKEKLQLGEWKIE